MPDEFSEVSSESWFGRIGQSIKGVLFGLVLIPASIFVLSWNEGRSVTTAKSLREAAGVVISADAAAVSPGNQNKLIHVSGEATTTDAVSDPIFGVAATALRLSRQVEMYQWKEKESSETKKKFGGGTETTKTYTYEKTWAKERIDSSSFKHPEEHLNTGQKIAPDTTVTAPHVTLGAFKVPARVVGQMKGDEALVPTEEDLAKVGPDLRPRLKVSGGGYYYGADASVPAVGDQRVAFKALRPAVFSVVAQQMGDTFTPFHAPSGRDIERVESGTVTAASMFEHAASENALMTWLLRGLGLFMMSFGIGLILNPISVFGDLIPFIGSILGGGVALAAILLGVVGTLITIAIAWIVVRPVLGVTLLVLAVAGLVFARQLGAKRAAARKLAQGAV